MAAQAGGDPTLTGMATALALGIGIQNIPGKLRCRYRLFRRASRPKAFAMGASFGLGPSRCFERLSFLAGPPHNAVHVLDAHLFRPAR